MDTTRVQTGANFAGIARIAVSGLCLSEQHSEESDPEPPYASFTQLGNNFDPKTEHDTSTTGASKALLCERHKEILERELFAFPGLNDGSWLPLAANETLRYAQGDRKP